MSDSFAIFMFGILAAMYGWNIILVAIGVFAFVVIDAFISDWIK